MALKIKFLFLAAALVAAGTVHGQARPQANSDNTFVVMIDPGHGGKAGGTSGTGRYRETEKHIVLDVALKLRKLLQDNAPDIKPLFTRTTDVDVSLNNRSIMANKAKANLFVSIHCNSLANVKRDGPKIWGAETYVMSLNKLDVNKSVAKTENADILLEDNYKEVYKGFDPSDPASVISIDLQQSSHLIGSIELAKLVQQHLGTTADRKDKGVKQDVFWVICHNTMPSILTEIGFLSNPAEEDFLHSDQGRQQVAQALFNAIVDYKARFFDPMNGDDNSPTPSAPGQGIDLESILAAQLGDSPAGQSDGATPAEAAQTPSSITYCVQLTSSPSPLNTRTNSLLKKFTGATYFREAGLYKYTTARTPSFSQAQKDLTDARSKGAKDAFIVAFDGERKISVSQAQRQATR